MVYDEYTRQWIILLGQCGLRPARITQILANEGIRVTRQGVRMLLKKLNDTGTTARRVGSGRPSKITPTIKALVDAQMVKDDETTSVQLLKLLRDNGIQLSLVTILRCRSSLGWTFRGSAYCQLIRDVNKVKRLDWCKANSEDNFENVIFTDECSINNYLHYACLHAAELHLTMTDHLQTKYGFIVKKSI